MSMNVDTIITAVNMPESTSIENIQAATCEDVHLQKLKSYMKHGWLQKKKN